MKRKLLFVLLSVLMLIGCDKQELAPGNEIDENEHLDQYVHIDDDTKKKPSPSISDLEGDGTFVYGDIQEEPEAPKEDIRMTAERFLEEIQGKSKDFIIVIDEDKKIDNKVIFKLLYKGEAMKDIYLNATIEGNDVMTDMTILSNEEKGLSAETELDRDVLWELLDTILYGLTMPEAEKDFIFHRIKFLQEPELDQEVRRSIRSGGIDIFAERTNEGVTIAFHPEYTFSEHIMMEDHKLYGEEDAEYLEGKRHESEGGGR